ncbi:hypothetical protein BTW00_05560 [Psychrobacter sp. C 20.9]|uniref:hypothetical protein n=1 Tax=Psychrobacter sp. C 20.9 TaxID=1926477 RepID=UPI000946ECCE|nr:hypothetical protein [Psychrobacter sp. C 20.9]OLF36552.1 hypothetical protein BTW00_05560 [Psychrobacter sp. C 20.9]
MNKNIEKKALSVIQDFNKSSKGLERQAIIITYTDNDNITTFNDGDAGSVLLTMANSLAHTLSEVVVNMSADEQHVLIENVCNEVYSMAINKLDKEQNDE